MPRMKRARYVEGRPVVTAFIPEQHPPWGLDDITLTIEGLEAIRLCDYEGFEQQAAAERMEISRPTLGRVLAEARAIVAEALVRGKRLRIEGGDYTFESKRRGRRHSRRRGRD